MDQQCDSIGSNAAAPLVFEVEQDESDSGDFGALNRLEHKLSLSKYETVRALSSSGEVTINETEEREADVVKQKNTHGMKNDMKNVNNHMTVGQKPTTSTPIKTTVDIDAASTTVGFSPVTRRNTDDYSTDCTDSGETLKKVRSVSEIDPLTVRVPLEGFEVMEQRARFTVFKLHVHLGTRDSWFVFRRYTDFVQLQKKVRRLFPMFRLPLPPRRWFKNNFDPDFLEDRKHGLQAFIDSVLCHRDLCNCSPVQEFFCFTDPPGPHDSVEESRAYCEELEDAVYNLKKDLREKDTEIELLRDELGLYKKQVEMLSKALREQNKISSINVTSTSSTAGAVTLSEIDVTAPESDQSVPSFYQSSAQPPGLNRSRSGSAADGTKMAGKDGDGDKMAGQQIRRVSFGNDSRTGKQNKTLNTSNNVVTVAEVH